MSGSALGLRKSPGCGSKNASTASAVETPRARRIAAHTGEIRSDVARRRSEKSTDARASQRGAMFGKAGAGDAKGARDFEGEEEARSGEGESVEEFIEAASY